MDKCGPTIFLFLRLQDVPQNWVWAAPAVWRWRWRRKDLNLQSSWRLWAHRTRRLTTVCCKVGPHHSHTISQIISKKEIFNDCLCELMSRDVCVCRLQIQGSTTTPPGCSGWVPAPGCSKGRSSCIQPGWQRELWRCPSCRRTSTPHNSQVPHTPVAMTHFSDLSAHYLSEAFYESKCCAFFLEYRLVKKVEKPVGVNTGIEM